MTYKSFPLVDVFTIAGIKIAEIEIINNIEKFHSARNLKPTYQKPLANHIRFLPIDCEERSSLTDKFR